MTFKVYTGQRTLEIDLPRATATDIDILEQLYVCRSRLYHSDRRSRPVSQDKTARRPKVSSSMGGPGGGPPRKSHTKSRKGCRTCKKRHIRCSEEFPQCKNCTKHSVRCDYMDMTNAGEEPPRGSGPPDLLTSPELQTKLDDWRLTGEPPLAELRVSDSTYWPRFSTIDLRLIYHITVVYSDMYRKGYSANTVWASKMPK